MLVTKLKGFDVSAAVCIIICENYKKKYFTTHKFTCLLSTLNTHKHEIIAKSKWLQINDIVFMTKFNGKPSIFLA